MHDLLERAIEQATHRRGGYADARIVENQSESLLMRDGIMEVLDSAEDYGFGIRVLVDGSWGFASSHDLRPAEFERVTEQAIRIAKASALVPGGKVDLGSAGARRRS